jgi:hypothetical protein
MVGYLVSSMVERWEHYLVLPLVVVRVFCSAKLMGSNLVLQ